MNLNSWPDALLSIAWQILFLSALFGWSSTEAQLAPVPQAKSDSYAAPSIEAATIAGVVLNAVTNQPITRVLVQAGAHSMLTERDGKFQFADVPGSSAMLRVTKPGYYDALDSGSPGKYITFRASSDHIKLYLYPEALITGTISDPNGDPISGVYVQALRKATEYTGTPWMVATQALTSADGQFRLPVSAGDYVIETHYLSIRTGRPSAVLPAIAPDPSSSTGSATLSGTQPSFHIHSGDEQQLDLRLTPRPTHEVRIQSDGQQNGGVPQIEAHLANDLSFFAVSRQSGNPGEVVITLPTGSYTLTMNSGDRDGNRYGQTSVTVADSDINGMSVHMARLPSIPVEVIADDASKTGPASDNPLPTAHQFGLHFIRSDETAPQPNNPPVYLQSGRDQSESFTLPPGRYWLQAQESYQWFIESATIGGTDLLTQQLEVDPGASSGPLRIKVSNQIATLKGIVRLNAQTAANCWVYLSRTAPSLTPVISTVSGNDGTFSRPSLPPGEYRAIAFEVHSSASVNDPATLQRLASYAKTFTVAAGGTATIDLEAVPVAELIH